MNEEILKLLNEMLNEDLDLQGITDSVTKIKAIIQVGLRGSCTVS